MIFAEVHGKLGQSYSRAHERAEDLFTSTTFGLLRYLALADGLVPLMSLARPVMLTDTGVLIRRAPGWLDLERAMTSDVEFWPSFDDFGEPDLLLTFRDAARVPIHVVLIEAKLHSPKSGKADEDEDDADPEWPDPDQLVKYWQGLQRLPSVRAGAPASLVYLTSHGAPPARELADSASRMRGMRLAWLSWRDVWQVARRAASSNLPAADLARLLDHKGLRYFDGFHASPSTFPASGHFLRLVPLFSLRTTSGIGWPAALHDRNGHFWRSP